MREDRPPAIADEILHLFLHAQDIGAPLVPCLLYTSDAADERSSVDLGGRRIIKKKNTWRHHS